MPRFYDAAIHSLVMIRLGQQLGTDSDLAQAVAAAIDAAIRLAGSFLG